MVLGLFSVMTADAAFSLALSRDIVLSPGAAKMCLAHHSGPDGVNEGLTMALGRRQVRRKVCIVSRDTVGMPGPSKKVVRHLEGAELADAIEEAQKAGKTRLLRRLCCIRNLYKGDTVTEAADRVGVAQPTGSRWIEAWNANGVAGLEPDFGGGRPPKLSAQDRAVFRNLLEQHSPLTTGRIQQLLEQGFDVTYSRRHIPRLLEELGMGERIHRPRLPNRPAEAEEILEENLENALAVLEEGVPVGSKDRGTVDDA